MGSDAKKVILVAGASTGMGERCAALLHAQGHRVYAASRSIVGREPKPPYEVLALDVNDEASVQACVARVLEREGRLDVLVNSAGFGIAGSVEDTSLADARRQLDTNFFGAAALCRAVLPAMRERRAGLIVNIASIGGIIPMPFQAYYCASKAALTSFGRALRLEVAPFGVQVVTVEPGDYNTEFTGKRELMPQASKSAYGPFFTRTMDIAVREERKAPGPESVGVLVAQIVNARAPVARYLAGPIFQRFSVWLEKWLPQRVFHWALSKYFGLG